MRRVAMKRKESEIGSVLCMINGEIGTVLAVMRRNARWVGSDVADDDQWEHSLVHSLKSLRKDLFTWQRQNNSQDHSDGDHHHPWEEINPCLYLQPFLDVVCADETTAPVAGVSLSAICNILSFEAFGLSTNHIEEAMHRLVEAITSFHLKVKGPDSEDVLLMKILQVLLVIMKHEASQVLCDSDLCLVITTCFRAVQQAVTKGEILQRTVRHSVLEIIRVVFSRLPELEPVQQQQQLAINSVDVKVGFHETANLENSSHANGGSSSSNLKLDIEAVDEATSSKTTGYTGSSSQILRKARPYGIVGVTEVFHYLCSLLDSGTSGHGIRAIDEDVPLFSLGLISTAVGLGGSSFALHEELFDIVQGNLFMSVMQLALHSKNPLILSVICSIVLNLYHHLRRHLKLQLEVFFSCVLMRLAEGKHGTTYQQQEVAMEALVYFCRQPMFVLEMYANFDCDIGCINLFEDLVNLLSKSAFPVNLPLSAMSILSLEGLVAIIQIMVDRLRPMQQLSPQCIDFPVSEFVPFWTSKCDNYKDPYHWVPFVQRQKCIKKKLMIGADQFNRDQEKGLEFLQAMHLLPENLDASTVACFLRYTMGLDKALIGDFLGDPEEFALEVLKEFTNTFDFKGMSLDAAMRVFLATFRLPGEAQKIHRILEAFAERFYAQSSQILANQDAVFLLSYSLIMLNTDQHNSHVKKKMSEEDFIRNNRKINAGRDLPREYLSGLYHSIVKSEIKMSYGKGGGSEMSSGAWVRLMHKSENMQPYWICDSRAFLDSDMFSIISGPAAAAISVVFDNAEEDEVLRLCEQGYLGVAKISASYNLVELFDDLVVSLCRFTTLLNPTSTSNDLLFLLSEDQKVQIAISTVFKIANTYGDHIRSSWQNILDCIIQLQKIGLLNAPIIKESASEVDVVSELVGRPVTVSTGAAITAISAANKKRPSGLIGRFSKLLYMELDDPKPQPRKEELDAHQHALKLIESCHIDRIFSGSHSLQADSLLQLAKTLIRMSGRPQSSGGSFEGEDIAVFCFDLLIAIALENRDRILLLWYDILEHISVIVQTTDAPCPLVETAVFGLLCICNKLIAYKEELADELLRSLPVILKLDAHVADVLCEKIMIEVMQLVKANARHIQSPWGWRTVATLLSITARHLEASDAGFETLSFIMFEGAHLTQANYVLFVDAARAFAEASTGGVERSLAALNLLSDSVECLINWSGVVLPTTAVGDITQELGEMWLKLAQSHRRLITEPREDVRSLAVSSLQRVLSAAEIMHLSALTLVQLMEQVIFVMIDDLLEETANKHSPKESRSMENTLLSAVKLVSIVFLQFLDQLSGLPGFPAIWSGVLKHMERCMKIRVRGKRSEKLHECVPELLKNMLLVMKTRGILAKGNTLDGYTLWELTWHYVQSIAPLFEAELFPQESENQSRPDIE